MKWSGILLFLCTLALTATGMVILASVGDVQGSTLFGNKYHFVVRQTMYLSVSLVGCLAAALIRPPFLFQKKVLVFCLLLIVASILAVELFGITTKGAQRWIRLGGMQVQPSEFVKVLFILVFSGWVGATSCKNQLLVPGVLIPCAGLGIVVGSFVGLQHDLGSAVMLSATCGVLLFLSGARFKYLLIVGGVALLLAVQYVLNDPERMSRVTSSVQMYVSNQAASPEEKSDDDDSYQVRMSLSAFGAGGLTGKGYGNSLFKQRYLPENHTDFILAMIGEEFGLVATTCCWFLFLCITILGIRISLRAPDRQQQLFASGLTFYLGSSAAVNIGVVTGALPTKGLALPFLSYGGSNLMASYLIVGLLLSIAFHTKVEEKRDPENYTLPSTDIWGR